MTVFDAAHSGFQRAGDPARIVDMHHHIGPPIFGGPDGGPDLLLEKFGYVQRIVERCRAAARHQLDLGGSLTQILAHGRRNRIGPVGDPRGSELLDVRHLAAAAAVGMFVDHPEIPVSRGLGDHRPAGIDPRPVQHAVVDRLLQSEDGSARVADGRKSAHERGTGLAARHQMRVGGFACQQIHHRIAAQVSVPMSVDEAGHQKTPLSVDAPHGLARCGFGGRAGDLFDPVVPDEHAACEGPCVRAVENFDVVD